MMKRIVTALGALLTVIGAHAQNTEWLDTLQAAVKLDARRIEVSLGRLQTGLQALYHCTAWEARLR